MLLLVVSGYSSSALPPVLLDSNCNMLHGSQTRGCKARRSLGKLSDCIFEQFTHSDWALICNWSPKPVGVRKVKPPMLFGKLGISSQVQEAWAGVHPPGPMQGEFTQSSQWIIRGANNNQKSALNTSALKTRLNVFFSLSITLLNEYTLLGTKLQDQ